MDFNSFKDTITQAQSIVILSHVNPDGDTLGTMCALYNAIKTNFAKEADMVYAGIIPEIYHFLPDIDKAKPAKDLAGKKYDLAIAVDVAAKDRMTDGLGIFDSAKKELI